MRITSGLVMILISLNACSNTDRREIKDENDSIAHRATNTPVGTNECYESVKIVLLKHNLTVVDSFSALPDNEGFYFKELNNALNLNFYNGLKHSFGLKLELQSKATEHCYLFVNVYDNPILSDLHKRNIDSLYKLPYNKINAPVFDQMHKDPTVFFTIENCLIFYPDQKKGLLGYVNDILNEEYSINH
jgi:hypothetical protein